jgi:transcriptional regulator with XRE-family HTH domain
MVITVHHQRYIKLRTFLKKLRTDAGLTQVEIAERLQLDQSNVSKVERGERYVDTLFFIDYCKACGIEPFKAMQQLEADDTSDSCKPPSINERF